ncbi:MAG: hypothetical protein ACREA9_22920 [Pyrinomonadaceae bacterium]
MTTWIVSAGAEGRDYTEFFYRFGMAFVGGKSQRAAMAKVATGDTILLKRGIAEFLAVGTVVERNGHACGDGDKAWLRDFDGWDLGGYCYVDWHVAPQPEPASGLRMGTIYQTTRAEHIAVSGKLLAAPVRPPASEPAPTRRVSDSAILAFLIREGLRVSAADELTEALRRIRLLAEYYYEAGHKNGRWSDIREHETRTFLVIPLLLALGWAEQQLKIELPVKGGKVDIACFDRSFRGNPADVVALIETKGFSSGLDYAPKQAHAYAKHFTNCQSVLVTNGYCYKTYMRQNDETFGTNPSAYLNIVRPRNRYPLDPDNVDGAFEVLRWLLPKSLRAPGEVTPTS